MKRTLVALTVAAGLLGGAAFAQTEEMNTGLSMLELAAAKEFARIGIDDVDPMSLTLTQLAEIRLVLDNGDSDATEQEQQIRNIVSR